MYNDLLKNLFDSTVKLGYNEFCGTMEICYNHEFVITDNIFEAKWSFGTEKLEIICSL
jgi:hypothetical protein